MLILCWLAGLVLVVQLWTVAGLRPVIVRMTVQHHVHVEVLVQLCMMTEMPALTSGDYAADGNCLLMTGIVMKLLWANEPYGKI